jgi:prolyl-tRNA editing enzyme YbaK/EbsC (Cys-tRNA(Pro) deacylase)
MDPADTQQTTAYPTGGYPPVWGERSYAQTAPAPPEEER